MRSMHMHAYTKGKKKKKGGKKETNEYRTLDVRLPGGNVQPFTYMDTPYWELDEYAVIVWVVTKIHGNCLGGNNGM